MEGHAIKRSTGIGLSEFENFPRAKQFRIRNPTACSGLRGWRCRRLVRRYNLLIVGVVDVAVRSFISVKRVSDQNASRRYRNRNSQSERCGIVHLGVSCILPGDERGTHSMVSAPGATFTFLCLCAFQLVVSRLPRLAISASLSPQRMKRSQILLR